MEAVPHNPQPQSEPPAPAPLAPQPELPPVEIPPVPLPTEDPAPPPPAPIVAQAPTAPPPPRASQYQPPEPVLPASPPAVPPAPGDSQELRALQARLEGLEQMVEFAVREITQTIKQLANRVDDARSAIKPTDVLPMLFPAQQTHSDGRWKELTAVSTSIVDLGTPGTDGRNCTSSSHASAPMSLGESQGFFLEVVDGTDHRYIWIPNGEFRVYVTQVGGSNGHDGTGGGSVVYPTYTYDVFYDVAKTIKIGTALSVADHRPLQVAVHAGTHGHAQWENNTLILLNVDEYFDRDGCS